MRRAAAESFVLLQNRDATLPIVAPADGSQPVLAVIGPNAALAMIQGGGSARVSQFPPVTPLSGLQERFGDDVSGRARAGLFELQTDAGTRLDRARRATAGVVLRRARTRRRAGARGARRPGLVHLHRAVHAGGAGRVLDAHRGQRRRAGDGRVDVQPRADRPGPIDDRRRGRRRQLGAHRPQRSLHGFCELRSHRHRSS